MKCLNYRYTQPSTALYEKKITNITYTTGKVFRGTYQQIINYTWQQKDIFIIVYRYHFFSLPWATPAPYSKYEFHECLFNSVERNQHREGIYKSCNSTNSCFEVWYYSIIRKDILKIARRNVPQFQLSRYIWVR